VEIPPNPLAIRTLRDDELARLRESRPDLPTTPRNCVTCAGRGTFRWKDAQGEPTDWTCNCVEQFVLHRYLLHAGIDLRYQRLGWADVKRPAPGSVDLVWDYVENSDFYLTGGAGLTLFGDIGTGKTLLGTLLLKSLLAQGHDCYSTTFYNMINAHTRGWRDKDQEAWFVRRITNAKVLLIDDIGREVKNDAASLRVIESMFDHVIRSRVAACRPTIVTTNLTDGEFLTLYKSNVLSLLAGSNIRHHFKGESYRDGPEMARLDDERKARLTRPIVLA
jgi:DNA replication protein DnaC